MTKLALVIGVLVLATLLVLGVLWLVKNTRFGPTSAPLPKSPLEEVLSKERAPSHSQK